MQVQGVIWIANAEQGGTTDCTGAQRSSNKLAQPKSSSSAAKLELFARKQRWMDAQRFGLPFSLLLERTEQLHASEEEVHHLTIAMHPGQSIPDFIT